MHSVNTPLLEMISLLKDLKPETLPLWGEMTAQHMVEHLTGAVLISSGDLIIPQHTEDQKLPGFRAFLFSRRSMPKNIKSPVFPEELQPLRNPDLDSAIDSLKLAIEKFHQYHQGNPGAKPVNPIFGPLTYNEWIQFHQKHFRHHLSQFGLTEN